MTVFSCAACRQQLGPALREVAMPSPVTEESPGDGLPPLVPRGAYAVSPRSGAFVLHPDDVSGTVEHPDRGRLSGCCGLDGLDGPNLVCSACGAEVATRRSDCWGQQVTALGPDAVTAAVTPAG